MTGAGRGSDGASSWRGRALRPSRAQLRHSFPRQFVVDFLESRSLIPSYV
jgi:hypothetical protein